MPPSMLRQQPTSQRAYPGRPFAVARAPLVPRPEHWTVLTCVFPSRRTLEEAEDPVRALEEERRLAYVAWTRARRSLLLVYDPFAPSV
jgi:hypothetical protein